MSGVECGVIGCRLVRFGGRLVGGVVADGDAPEVLVAVTDRERDGGEFDRSAVERACPSADRANAGRGVIVGLRALEVEVLDSSGKHLATHPRAYGQASTNSEDPSMQLALLCNKPASWPNSRVRDALPDPLREWLDRQDRQTRNEALQTLKRVDRESGWANAVEAMLSILESTGGADRAGVTLLAARLAEGVAGIEYDDDRPDLSEYDIAFTADVGVQEGGR
ncbi:hypothetical protein BIL_05080 [Bifidobacterium longum subsp. longum F8]|nr:hypothetical protein BIL_05080 [Bifidobacterium longum subsp. longum F8]